MHRILFIFLLITAVTFFSCSIFQKKPIENTETEVTELFISAPDLNNVLETAQNEGKIVFVDIYTTWCTPCKVMDREVYTDPEVIRFLQENMISYKVDAEKDNGPDMMAIYEVLVFPTLLFLDDKGREISRSDGALDARGFLKLAEKANSIR